MDRSTPIRHSAEAGSPTLRQRLAQSPPRTFKLARAWAPLLKALRQARRDGAPVRYHDRTALNRALDAPPLPSPDLDARLEALKAALGEIARGDADAAARADTAVRADAALAALLPRVVEAPVRLQVEGWSPGFDAWERARLLGAREDAARPPEEAAAVVSALDGLVIAGRTLAVRAGLGEGEALPRPPPRQRGRRGRAKPWLTVDEEGRWSLTPRHIAEAQASEVSGPVLDVFCGCGGNAIAFALAGSEVTAVDLDAGRLRLARENARRFGVEGRITFVHGDTVKQAPPRLTAGATVFLDPPWGGPGQAPLTWATLLGPLPADWPPLRARLLVKAPAAFDVDTLPASHDWTVRYAFGSDGSHDAGIVKLLTLTGEPR